MMMDIPHPSKLDSNYKHRIVCPMGAAHLLPVPVPVPGRLVRYPNMRPLASLVLAGRLAVAAGPRNGQGMRCTILRNWSCISTQSCICTM